MNNVISLNVWAQMGDILEVSSCEHILLYEYESLFCNIRRYANHKFVAIINIIHIIWYENIIEKYNIGSFQHCSNVSSALFYILLKCYFYYCSATGLHKWGTLHTCTNCKLIHFTTMNFEAYNFFNDWFFFLEYIFPVF